MDHTKFSTYGFGADYRPWVIENKTSVDWTMRPSSAVTMQSTAGFAYRYPGVSAGESRGRGYQVIDRRDISLGALANDRFQGPFNSDGEIPVQLLPGGLVRRRRVLRAVEHRLKRSERARRHPAGLLHAGLHRPLQRRAARPGPEQRDRGHLQRERHLFAGEWHLIPYFTYATSTYLELGQGSELDQAMVANGTYLQDSDLFEGGVKFSGAGGRVFASVSAFRQKRTAVNKESGRHRLLPDDRPGTRGARGGASQVELHRRLHLAAAGAVEHPVPPRHPAATASV